MSFVLSRFVRQHLLVLAVLAVVGGLSTPAFSLTWTVDRNSLACTDSGPGDAITPFCTIKKAGQLAVAGDTVEVRPGTYREHVTPPASGTPGLPITYRTFAPGVILLGTDDLSDAAGWATTATTAWSRAFAPSSPPTQVFVDGARLALATGPASTFPGSFFYDALAGVLYVDIGGLNPAVGHVVEAGARTYGFNLVSRSHVVVDGFDIRRQNSAGVRLATASSNLTVRNNIISNTGSYGILSDAGVGPILIEANTVSLAASVGIRLLNSTGVTVRGNDSHSNLNHGIALQGSSNNLIEGNTSYLNARPKVRAANGLDVNAVSLQRRSRQHLLFEPRLGVPGLQRLVRQPRGAQHQLRERRPRIRHQPVHRNSIRLQHQLRELQGWLLGGGAGDRHEPA